MKVVGKTCTFLSKLHFIWYSTSESMMIMELFSNKSYMKILFSRFIISFFPFSDLQKFFKNFTEISQNFHGKFLKNFGKFINHSPTHPPYTSHIPITHTITHTTRTYTHIPSPTSTSIFSIFRFYSKCTCFSYHLHLTKAATIIFMEMLDESSCSSYRYKSNKVQ